MQTSAQPPATMSPKGPVKKEPPSQDAVVESIVLQYLKDKGYHKAAQIVQEQAASKNASTKQTDQNTGSKSADIDRYTLLMGLKADVCTGNNVLFWGVNEGNPLVYEDSFNNLVNWISNSLDTFKNELYSVLFPLFVHCFLELMSRGFVREAKAFFEKHADEVRKPFQQELQQLALIVTPNHIKTNECAQRVLRNKFQITMSLLSFELLSSFLSDSQMFLLLYILNKRVNIRIVRNQPNLKAKGLGAGDDVKLGMVSLVHPESAKIETEKLAGSATQDPESIAHQDSVESVPPTEDVVYWGVFPTKTIEIKHKGRDKGLTEKKDAKTDLKRPPTEKEKEDQQADKKKLKKDEPQKGTKKDDQSKQTPKKDEVEKKPEGKSGEALKLDGSKKEDEAGKVRIIQPEGPIPDRKDEFNSNILEKIVLRKPQKVKLEELEDSRLRARLGPSALPSALCHTFFNTNKTMTCTEMSEDARYIAAGFEDSTVRVWSNDWRETAEPGSENQEIDGAKVLVGHSAPVYACSLSPDNHFVLSGSADASIRLWSLAVGSNIVVYRGHNYPVWDVAFSSTGYYFASASMDRTARLWSTDNLYPLRLFVGHVSDVESVRFHPNCNYIATGGSDKSARLWDVQSGKCVRLFNGHLGPVRCLAFSPNGKVVASAGGDPFINLWDLGSGKKLTTFNGHTGPIYSLDFSKDGSMLASGGADNTVRLWDASSFSSSLTGKSHQPAALRKPQTASENGIPPSDRVKSIDGNLDRVQNLMKTLYTKRTPVFSVKFTNRNLLLVGGCYNPQL